MTLRSWIAVRLGAERPDEAPKKVGLRRFVVACATGAALSILAFVALISQGFSSFDRRVYSSDFYDVQGRAMIHGRFDVPAQVAGLEGIASHGKTYVYFGPFLSVLRIPIIKLFPATTGHLAEVSMTLAFALFLAAAIWLVWLARCLVRGEGEPTWLSMLAHGAFVMVLGIGSVAFYLGSRPSVYYETELWGAALALWCLVFFAKLTQTRQLHWVAGLSAATFCVALTRVSIALGMLFLLGVVAVGSGIEWLRARSSPEPDDAPPGAAASDAWRRFFLSAASLVVTCVVLVGVNLAKFGTLLSIPFRAQEGIRINLTPMATSYFAHHNDVLGLRFLPTTLFWYLNPKALHFSSLFPYVGFTRDIRVLGGVQFAWLQPSSSITASMPLLFSLAILGAVVLLGPRRLSRNLTDRGLLSGFRWILAGGALASFSTLLFAGVVNRYLADFLPLLVVAAVVGFAVVCRWWAKRGVLRRVGLVAVVGLLGAASIYVTVGLSLQEAFVLHATVDGQSGAGYLSAQLSASARLNGSHPVAFDQGPVAPPSPQYGGLYVLNACQALYTYQFAGWGPVEIAQSAGQFHLELTMPVNPPQGPVSALVVSGTDPTTQEFWGIRFLPGNRYVLRWTSQIELTADGPHVPIETAPQPYVPGVPLRMDLSIAGSGPVGSEVAIARVGGRQLLVEGLFYVHRTSVWTVGHFPSGAPETFPGTLRLLPVSTPICDRLTHQH